MMNGLYAASAALGFIRCSFGGIMFAYHHPYFFVKFLAKRPFLG